MVILFAAIDLAKNDFAVAAVNQAGKAEPINAVVPRARLTDMSAALPPCTIGVKARTGRASSGSMAMR